MRVPVFSSRASNALSSEVMIAFFPFEVDTKRRAASIFGAMLPYSRLFEASAS
jgi:hypothetical protein